MNKEIWQSQRQWPKGTINKIPPTQHPGAQAINKTCSPPQPALRGSELSSYRLQIGFFRHHHKTR